MLQCYSHGQTSALGTCTEVSRLMSILTITTDQSSLFMAPIQCPEQKQSENKLLEGLHEAEHLWSCLCNVNRHTSELKAISRSMINISIHMQLE